MTARDFCFWLRGFMELRANKGAEFSTTQVAQVDQHLSLVFIHEIDPSMGGPEKQATFNAAHGGIPTGPGKRC